MQNALLTVIVSFLLMMVLGPVMIPLLRRLRVGQTVRDNGLVGHAAKQGVLTMGGLVTTVALVASALLFAPLSERWKLMLVCLLFVLGFTLVGFLDDYIKVVKRRSLGLRAWQKIVLQLGLSVGLAFYCYNHEAIGPSILVPFTSIEWNLGIWYIPFATFVILACVNSANLLDGADGLCSSVTTVITVTLMLIALFMKTSGVNPGTVDTAMVLCAAMSGACLGFLRYNAFPARLILGDVGAFQLGAVVVVAALILRLPLIIPLVAIMYLVSSVSDILQALSYKFAKKRLFLMAPLHHHFQQKGISETKIVSMYTAVTIVFCLIALISLGV